jgi:RNA polymerase-binding transcription factor DksA
MALTRKQKLDLERIIRKRRAKLADELLQDAAKARDEEYAEIGGAPSADSGDEATADIISDIDQAELSRDLLELRELDHAIARLTEREFGTCLDCGGEIGFERLSACPTAIRWFDCQRLYEKTFVLPRTPSL